MAARVAVNDITLNPQPGHSERSCHTHRSWGGVGGGAVLEVYLLALLNS